MAAPQYERSVFVNCPFDEAYRPLFESIVFAIYDCGYFARSALEVDDGSEVRIEKIGRIIASCRFGIHDISRTDPDAGTGLPRFNMPLELGMFLGAKRYGRAEQKQKNCLILDVERYRYQKFMSDIAGQDIAAHGGDINKAVRIVRDWLSSDPSRRTRVPGGHAIATRYEIFLRDLPTICASSNLRRDELTFTDYVMQIEEWLRTWPQVST
jgi:hypothetical protein